MVELFDLTGRVAIVTGGNGGIGFGMARGLAQAGAMVVIAARDEDKGAGVVAELQAFGTKASFFPLDVANEASVREMVAATLRAFDRIDILVNNAGTQARHRPEDFPLSDWWRVLDTNLTGALLCAQAVYPVMQGAGGGKVINVSSVQAVFAATHSAAYSASKAAMLALTRTLALAWASDNIQVNAVLPGYIDTEMTRAGMEFAPQFFAGVLARTPARRKGMIDDMAGVAVFLASSASDFITGTALPVDGGYLIQG
jgi:2-deoxy-D-gluconate 3-dehydrogenase